MQTSTIVSSDFTYKEPQVKLHKSISLSRSVSHLRPPPTDGNGPVLHRATQALVPSQRGGATQLHADSLHITRPMSTRSRPLHISLLSVDSTLVVTDPSSYQTQCSYSRNAFPGEPAQNSSTFLTDQ